VLSNYGTDQGETEALGEMPVTTQNLSITNPTQIVLGRNSHFRGSKTPTRI